MFISNKLWKIFSFAMEKLYPFPLNNNDTLRQHTTSENVVMVFFINIIFILHIQACIIYIRCEYEIYYCFSYPVIIVNIYKGKVYIYINIYLIFFL